MPDFDSPKFLIRQTRENVTEFVRLCQAFFRDNKSVERVDVDPETGNKTFKLVYGHALPDRCRHIAASGITDMRHALDQAAVAAYELVTGTDAPNRLYFPYAANPNGLRGVVRKDFPPELHPILEGFEAYPTGPEHPGGSDLLCHLSKAAQGKHRLSARVGGHVERIAVEDMLIHKGIPGGLRIPFRWDIEKGEMILCTTAPDGDFEAQIAVTYYIALYDAGPLTGRAVDTVLNDIAAIVERIVLGLEAETARILAARA